jgi:hypothetical protein
MFRNKLRVSFGGVGAPQRHVQHRTTIYVLFAGAHAALLQFTPNTKRILEAK